MTQPIHRRHYLWRKMFRYVRRAPRKKYGYCEHWQPNFPGLYIKYGIGIIEIVYFELESVSWSENEYNTTPLGCHVTPITENDTS